MKLQYLTDLPTLIRRIDRIPAHWWQGLLVLLIAFVLRIVALDMKPTHFDEGINGWFVDRMWQQGFYRYDPTNYHGPLYFYVLQFAELVMGRGIVTFRFVTALISTGIVAIVLLHRRWFGQVALWAALALAISPAMVFYGRYANHESLLVFSQALFIYGFIRWRVEGGRGAILCMAAGIVGNIATKETFIIFLGTWSIAWVLVIVADKILPLLHIQTRFAEHTSRREPVSLRYILATIAVSALVLLALFSGFLSNMAGFRDMFMAFAPWLDTGMGDASGHEKPFLYWWQLFARYEWPMLVALLAWPLLLFHESRWSWRFAATGFGLFLAYSLIPYKTPWLIIGIILPLAFTLGFLIELGRKNLRAPYNHLLVMLTGLLLITTSVTTLRLNFKDYANLTEPYVYVQTTTDVTRMMTTIENAVRQRPADRNMSLLVINGDPWPLPWLLGHYPGLTYGAADSVAAITADVVIVEQSGQEMVESALSRDYIRQPLQIRDAAAQGWVYYRLGKFRDIVLPDTEFIYSATGELAQ